MPRPTYKIRTSGAILSLIYCLSGMCALLYQMVWIEWFSRIFGSTIFAVSAVTAVFFGGLAVGSVFFGRWSARQANPVRFYALLEFGIAVTALLVPLGLREAESAYALIYPALVGNFPLLTLVRVIFAAVVLFLPAFFMGGTLPFISQAIVKFEEKIGSGLGWIYGLNTLGAALGSFLAGYFAFRFIGLKLTNWSAVVLNILIAAAALGISAAKASSGNPAAEAPSRTIAAEQLPVLNPADKRILICLALSGFAYLGYEMIWLRYLLLYFRDSSYLYSGIICVFIVGVALGGVVFGHLANRKERCAKLLAALMTGIGLVNLAAMIAPIRWYQEIVRLGLASPWYEILFVALAILPPTILMGGVFPVAARLLTREVQAIGSRAGLSYAVSTAGSILGALATGFILLPGLGLQNTLILMICLGFLGAMIVLGDERKPVPGLGRIVYGALIILLIVYSQLNARNNVVRAIIDQIRPPEEIVALEESVTGINWAAERPDIGRTDLYENILLFSKEGSPSFIIQGYVPVLLMPKLPNRVLGLCFGGGTTFQCSRLLDEVKQLDFVDISETNIKMALERLPSNRGLKEDPRSRFIIDDAYNYVKYTQEKYDLILIDANPPYLNFRCAALYTREFYAHCRERLNEAGYFSQVLPLNHMSERQILSVMKTFSSVFPHCLLWWNGQEPVMIGSNTEFSLDLAEIQNRLDRGPIGQNLARFSGEARYNYLSNFISGLLLTTQEFKTVASLGSLYTDDLLPMKYDNDYRIASRNMLPIYQNMTRWTEAAGIFRQNNVILEYENQLGESREYLMVVLYRMFKIKNWVLG